MNLTFAPLCAPESAPRPPVSTDCSSRAPKRTGTVMKKTVPPLLKPFEASLIPSTVTFTAPPGRLLYRVSPPIGGDAPCASRARASALPRLPKGNSLTVFDTSVFVTNWLDDSRTCAAPSVIVTVSVGWPTSSVTRTSVVLLVETETLGISSVLNPARLTVT